jgi:hypothetical protein
MEFFLSNGSTVLNGELERVRKKLSWPLFQIEIFFEQFNGWDRKIVGSVSQNSQELYLKPLKYERLLSVLQLRFLQLLAAFVSLPDEMREDTAVYVPAVIGAVFFF